MLEVELQAGNPLVCIGQSSVQIASHMKDISKRMALTKQQRQQKGEKMTSMENSTQNKARSERTADYLPIYKGIQAETTVNHHVEMLIEQTRAILEDDPSSHHCSYSVMRKISVLHGFGDCQMLLPTTLMEMRNAFPKLSLNTILTVPPENISGLAALYALVSTQAALSLSDSVMVRGTHDAQIFLALEMGQTGGNSHNGMLGPSHGPKTNLHKFALSDVHYCMACDIYTALSTTMDCNGENDCILWPTNVCSSQTKVYDVRSSVWRSIRQPNTKTTFHPLRAMANNIHALHLSCAPIINANQSNDGGGGGGVGNYNIRTGSMLDLKVGRDVHGHTVILGTPSQSIVPAELNVSFSWATPHTTWPQNMGAKPQEKSHPRMGTNAHMGEDYRGIRKIPSHSHHNMRGSSFSFPGENNVAGSRHNDNDSGAHPNVAVAFESLYGRMYLSNVVCPRAEVLLAVGAYSHRCLVGYFNHPAVIMY